MINYLSYFDYQLELSIGALAYHTMTSVYDPALSRLQSETFYSRLMWVKTQPEILLTPKDKGVDKSLIKTPGLYIFGGYNSKRECVSNALYVLKPSYSLNKKSISNKSGAFKKLVKPRYTFDISEVPQSGGGQPPSPRFLHSACLLSGKYLAIYGGRNDKMFNSIGNVALNDLHLFDLQRYMWMTVVIYSQEGQLPLSRWGHQLVVTNHLGQGSGDSMLLFGGVNLKSYCEGSTIFEFTLDEQTVAQHYEETEGKMKQLISKCRDSQMSGNTNPLVKQSTLASQTL